VVNELDDIISRIAAMDPDAFWVRVWRDAIVVLYGEHGEELGRGTMQEAEETRIIATRDGICVEVGVSAKRKRA
jgi:hypothetical protein